VTAPQPIVPTPAGTFGRLRGRRVIVGIPGTGFRGDLRADDPVVRGGRTFVPVLTEQDYYRAETDQIEVFAPLVPVDRVWVERATDVGPELQVLTSTLDAPAIRLPTPAKIAAHLIGCRMIQAVPDGHVRDLRAVSGTYTGDQGAECVRICGEAEWYRWAFDGALPLIVEEKVDRLWVE
jgi:hypothetical protein